jgi:hypothetical protein
MHAIIAAITLWWNASHLPDMRPQRVLPVVIAAELAQTREVPAALIVALVWPESRGELWAQPACGVMQVYPHDLYEPDSNCALYRASTYAGVDAGVREIEMMLAEKRVTSLRVALLYRACGGRAFVSGACEMGPWVDAALARARWLTASSPTG